jgi:hypothetical protein
MRRAFAFYRFLAIPGCLLWGLFELLALQRSRWSTRGRRRSEPALSR